MQSKTNEKTCGGESKTSQSQGLCCESSDEWPVSHFITGGVSNNARRVGVNGEHQPVNVVASINMRAARASRCFRIDV